MTTLLWLFRGKTRPSDARELKFYSHYLSQLLENMEDEAYWLAEKTAFPDWDGQWQTCRLTESIFTTDWLLRALELGHRSTVEAKKFFIPTDIIRQPVRNQYLAQCLDKLEYEALWVAEDWFMGTFAGVQYDFNYYVRLADSVLEALIHARGERCDDAMEMEREDHSRDEGWNQEGKTVEWLKESLTLYPQETDALRVRLSQAENENQKLETASGRREKQLLAENMMLKEELGRGRYDKGRLDDELLKIHRRE